MYSGCAAQPQQRNRYEKKFQLFNFNFCDFYEPQNTCIIIILSKTFVQLTQQIAAHEDFFHSSLISWNRNPVSRKLLKTLGTCASSSQSSTVNLILLSSSGAQSRNIYGSIVIIPSKLSRQIFQKPLNQFKSVPYGSGNTG